jgi:hypothetical protein
MVKIAISELNPVNFEKFAEGTEKISEAQLSTTRGGGDSESIFSGKFGGAIIIINSNNNNNSYGGSSSSSTTTVISGSHITTISNTNSNPSCTKLGA